MSAEKLVRTYAERRLERAELLLKRLDPRFADRAASLGESLEGLEDTLEELIEETEEANIELPDEALRRLCALSPFEHEVLWLAAAAHLDPLLREAYARANDNVLIDYPDGALCMRILCPARGDRVMAQAAFRAEGPLFRAGLLRLAARERSSNNRLLMELVPAEHVVASLVGIRTASSAVVRYGERLKPGVTLKEIPTSESVRVGLLAAFEGFYRRGDPEGAWFGAGGMDFCRGLGILFHGPQGSGRTLTIKALAGTLGLNLIVLDGKRLASANPLSAELCLQGACQESALYGEIVVIRHAEELVRHSAPLAPIIASELQRRQVAVVFCVESNAPLDASLDAVMLMRQGFQAGARASAAEVWQLNTPGECALGPEVDFDGAAGRFKLTRAQIRKAAHLAFLVAPNDDGTTPERASPMVNKPVLERSARAQISSALGKLARLETSQATLKDLVLPEETEERLHEIISAVNSRDMVLRRWGLGQRITRGRGITCLFDGEPGTGKTLAAEAISTELGLELMRVNIAGIVDKYIGETEKHLAELFARSRADTSLLLFDEADSLFSKRTEVTRSTDRYSNMDINVLLQLIEAYDGVTVLTTNLSKSIDQAFERRITFKVNFPLPEEPERERLWRLLLPESVPTGEEIDYVWLADTELSGGGVKNAVLRAGYSAAREGVRIHMHHLVTAARQEAAAEGRLVRDDDGY